MKKAAIQKSPKRTMILKTTKLSLVKSPKKRMTVKMSKNPKNAVMALKNLA